jgi:hypothetical protein
MLLKSRSPAMTASRIVSGPTLLTGICFCAACGRAMTLRTGKSGRYRYDTCCTTQWDTILKRLYDAIENGIADL